MLDVTPGQQAHGLGANVQGDFQDRRSPQRRSVPLQQGTQLQTQALGQTARTDAGRLHALQQPQSHGEVVHQLFDLLLIASGKSLGQRGQRVLQITIVIQRLNQKPQRGAVFFAQTQSQRLAVQMTLQRRLRTRHLGHVGVFIVIQVIAARLGFAAPLAVVGGHRRTAVALPALPIIR